jgi:hypothetical protein
MEGTTWSEQDAVDLWMEKHNISIPHEEIMELKKAVTAPRLASDSRIRELEGQLCSAREALVKAEEAMQSAWYELEPGPPVIGDQFIRQEDMEKRMKMVREVLSDTSTSPWRVREG